MNNKPSTMETIKDKASHLVRKVAGKTHNEPSAATSTTNPTPHKDHHTGIHTGAAVANTAVPQGDLADRAAYNEHSQRYHDHHDRDVVGGVAGGAAIAERVHHRHKKEHEHGSERGLERQRALNNNNNVAGTHGVTRAQGVVGTNANTVNAGCLAHPQDDSK